MKIKNLEKRLRFCGAKKRDDPATEILLSATGNVSGRQYFRDKVRNEPSRQAPLERALLRDWLRVLNIIGTFRFPLVGHSSFPHSFRRNPDDRR